MHQVFSDNASLVQAALQHRPPRPIDAVYLHIPFCFHKCHYCDFYSIVDDHDRQRPFVERMVAEIHAAADAVARSPLGVIRPTTIFVGGGTPTLLRPDLWQMLLHALRDRVDLSDLAEFTVEANPETLSAKLLDTLAAGGTNRLSIGAQSFHPGHLKTLERWHDPANVGRAVSLARAAGIDNINLDLIFAIPGQSLDEAMADLDAALSLRPTHLSSYALTYEPNTALTRKLELGRVDRCDEELEAQMYRATLDALRRAGFEHYEISNHALPGRRCRHNLVYWTNGQWLALGPSASGHIGGVRWKNVPHLGQYLQSASGAPVIDIEQLSDDQSIGEQLMLRLRLIDGVERRWLDQHVDENRRRIIERLIDDDMLDRTDTHIRLTERGLMLADWVTGQVL